MKMRVRLRLGWFVFFLLLCVAVLVLSIARGPTSSNAASLDTTAGIGIHLGNVSIGDWHDSYFSLIDGQKGKWPDVVVVMSNQVYRIEREIPGSCRITGVQVPGDPSPQRVWSYLQKAAKAGKQIVIRIYPSPGYFDEKHRLVSTWPVEDYCHADVRRSVDDVGEEICRIHEFNRKNELCLLRRPPPGAGQKARRRAPCGLGWLPGAQPRRPLPAAGLTGGCLSARLYCMSQPVCTGCSPSSRHKDEVKERICLACWSQRQIKTDSPQASAAATC